MRKTDVDILPVEGGIPKLPWHGILAPTLSVDLLPDEICSFYIRHVLIFQVAVPDCLLFQVEGALSASISNSRRVQGKIFARRPSTRPGSIESSGR